MSYLNIKRELLDKIFAERYKYGKYPVEEESEIGKRRPTRPKRITTGTPRLPIFQVATIREVDRDQLKEGETLQEMTPANVDIPDKSLKNTKRKSKKKEDRKEKLLFAGPFAFLKVPKQENLLPLVPEDASIEDIQGLRPPGRNKNARFSVKIVRPSGEVKWLRIPPAYRVRREKQLLELFGGDSE